DALPISGPRCATHHREKRGQRKNQARANHVLNTYNITEEQYQAIYEAQGGTCAICRRAKGTGRKRLAVDHDHSCCPGRTSCGRCVRSLCCATCNRILGHLRDDPEMVERILIYLVEPPGREVLKAWNARSEEHTSELQSRENLVCRLLLEKK